MARFLRTALVSVLAALALAGTAQAAGGHYAFDGGTAKQQGQVRAALNASSFDWSIVPAQITVHIAPGIASEATRGEIWLDSELVDSGTFAWGTVQHEYAHQVDFFVLTDAQRAALAPELGGNAWWQMTSTFFAHDELTSERFASTLAWAYWPSSSNTMSPDSNGPESAAVSPAKFRALLVSHLGPRAKPAAKKSLAQRA
jgi:hypothetical protein